MSLTIEEKQRIYEEERIRLEAQAAVKQETEEIKQKKITYTVLGLVIVLLGFIAYLWYLENLWFGTVMTICLVSLLVICVAILLFDKNKEGKIYQFAKAAVIISPTLLLFGVLIKSL